MKVSRRDFIGDYLGQTAVKTKQLLFENSYLIVEDAHLLCVDFKSDHYGFEALDTINRYAKKFNTKIVFKGDYSHIQFYFTYFPDLKNYIQID